MLVYKHTETIQYVRNYPTVLRKIQTLWVNNLGILVIKNAIFPGIIFI